MFNFKTRYFSPLIEWVLASVYPIFSKLFWEAFAPCFTLRETLRQLVHRTAFLEDFVWSCWTRKISFLFYKRIQIQNIGFIEVNSLGKEIQERCVFMEQKKRFGLVLGWLAVLEKDWADCDYEQLLRVVFSCFQTLVLSWLVFKSGLWWLLRYIFFYIFILVFFYIKQAKYSQLIVSCSTGDISLRDFYISTLDEFLPKRIFIVFPCLKSLLQ